MSRHVLVKLCFVMDCTGSMGPWIDAAKTKIQEMTDKVIADNPGTLVEVALVGYRDYGDIQRFHVVDFTEPENVMRELHLIRADGGDDEAEDVVGGLMRVLRLSWDGADVQMVVHIADAPAHGLQYHSPNVSDRFPEGDPSEWDPAEFINRMSVGGMHYTFVKITTATDTMLDVFYNAWTKRGTFRVIDLRPQHYDRRLGTPRNGNMSDLLSPAVSNHVSQVVSRYTASQDPGAE
jgi:hypothetical protein